MNSSLNCSITVEEPSKRTTTNDKELTHSSRSFDEEAGSNATGLAQQKADVVTTEMSRFSRKIRVANKGDLDLGTKLQEYIRKTALMAMGQEYAYNFIRRNNLQSLAFLYYSSWTSADQWVFKQLAEVQRREKALLEEQNTRPIAY
jgi:hypothetical protein